MNYVQNTRSAYQSAERAKSYKQQHQSPGRWAGYTMARAKRHILRVLRTIALDRKKCILDLPCGTGVLGPILSELENPVIAADVSFEMMKEAEGEYSSKSLLGYIQLDATHLPLQENSCAVITSIGFFHRLPDDIAGEVLEEMKHLRPKYLVATFSLNSPLQKLKRLILSKLDSDYEAAPTHRTKVEVHELLSKHGFSVVQEIPTVPVLSADHLFVAQLRSDESLG